MKVDDVQMMSIKIKLTVASRLLDYGLALSGKVRFRAFWLGQALCGKLWFSPFRRVMSWSRWCVVVKLRQVTNGDAGSVWLSVARFSAEWLRCVWHGMALKCWRGLVSFTEV
jgi:hypothetical protein